MEKPWLPRDESDETATDSAGSKRRRVPKAIQHTLHAWLERRSLEDQPKPLEADDEENEEDDEDETETGKKTVTFRRFLKIFFGRQVNREPVVPVALLGAEEDRPPKRPSDRSEGQPSEDPVAKTPTAPEESGTPVPESPLDPVVAARYEQGTQEDRTAPAAKEETGAPPEPENSRPEAASFGSATADKEWLIIDHRHEASQPAAAETAKQEKPDYRQNQKRAREVERRLKKVETAQKRTTETLDRHNKDRAVLDKIPKISPNVVEHTTVKSEQPAQSVKEILAQRHLERPVTPEAPAAPEAPIKPEALAKAHYETMTPETVLHKVEKAAEDNVALEGLFERRHETKDIDGGLHSQAAQTGATAAPKGSKATAGQAFPAAMVSPLLTPTIPDEPSVKPPIMREEHKQAAQHGFWAAIIFVVLLAILAFIR